MTKKTARKAQSTLKSSENRLKIYLQKVVKSNSFTYETFGKAVEPFITAELIKIFSEAGLIKKKSDYHIAKNKNEFPDFTLFTKPSLAIDYKAGNHSEKRGGVWKKATNSNNDLGTLNKWPINMKKFGDNILFIFVEYDFKDTKKKIVAVKTNPFYRFVGLNKEGLLKYREKDGHLRPKNFDEESPIKTFKQFDKLFSKTVTYRSKRIIKKHKKILKEASVKYEA